MAADEPGESARLQWVNGRGVCLLVAALVSLTDCGGQSAHHDPRPSSSSAGARAFDPDAPTEVTPPVPAAYANFGTTVALSGDTLAVGAPGPVGEAGGDPPLDALVPTPAVFVYRLVGDAWAEEATLTGVNLPAPDPSDAGFGTILALEGDTLVVGAPRQLGTNPDSRGVGRVYVFERADGDWSLVSMLEALNDDDQYRTFGDAVAISEGVIAVSDPAEDGFCGAVSLYERRGGVWSKTTVIGPETRIRGAGFGEGLALDHGTLAAAAPGIERAHVIEPGATEWVVTAAESIGPANFANRVAFQGDTLVVAAFTEGSSGSSSGAVYVYRRQHDGWLEEAFLKSPSPTIQGYFGWDLALHGETLLVAERQSKGPGSGYVKQGEVAEGAETRGAVWVFQRSGTTWSLQGVLKSPNGETEFASSVGAIALSDRFVAVGAYADDPSSREPSELTLPYAGGVFVWPW
jgi:hypothetical protein